MAPPRPRPPEDEPAHDILAAEEFVVPAPDPRLHRESAHDVLAAEEFVVPAPDPRLHREPAHDILAAEEFGVPAPGASGAGHAESAPEGRLPGPARFAVAVAALALVVLRRTRRS